MALSQKVRARIERTFRVLLAKDGAVVRTFGLVSPIRRRIHSYNRTRKNDRWNRHHANGWKGHKAATRYKLKHGLRGVR